jgi:hypothetical protein
MELPCLGPSATWQHLQHQRASLFSPTPLLPNVSEEDGTNYQHISPVGVGLYWKSLGIELVLGK